MDYLPAFHNVRGRLCLVVGGGEVGPVARRLAASGYRYRDIQDTDRING